MATLARSLTMPNGDEYQFIDPSVPEWARGETKPTYTAAEVGALPDTTTIPTKTSDLTNDSGFLTSDATWNGVTLDKTFGVQNSTIYIPYTTGVDATTAKYNIASITPSVYRIALYDGSQYLNSTTPKSTDNSTKVATTAYVKSQGYLTLADLPVYDGSVT